MTDLNNYILENCPQYIRALNNEGINYTDELVLKINRRYKHNTLITKQLIPSTWTEEEVENLICLIVKFKQKTDRLQYYYDHYEKFRSPEIKESENIRSKATYLKNKDFRLTRQRHKYNLQKILAEHKSKFIDTLNGINLLADKFSKNKIILGKITETNRVVLSNTEYLINTNQSVSFKIKKVKQAKKPKKPKK